MSGRLVAFVGSYSGAEEAGGITVLHIDRADGAVSIDVASRIAQPGEAGYLAYAASTRTLYAVDERKNDGRGPVGPRAAVHAFAVEAGTGALTPRNALPSPGAFPTYLAVDERRGALLVADHGGFDHVEHVLRRPDGTWGVEYRYDDSTVLRYRLEDDGSLAGLAGVHVLAGHGTDPNRSLQAGGHAQSGPHAHCVVPDPSGRWLLVADKGTDRILVFRLDAGLEPVRVFEAEPETGPRHLAFDPVSGRVYATYEFSSELVVLDFDAETGGLRIVSRCPATAGDVGRPNEPADVRVHPAGGVVYVNNRGEDTLARFSVDGDGRVLRLDDVRLAASVHPGLAARSIAVDPSGSLLLVADRPAHLVRAYAVARDGALTPTATAAVQEPAFVTFAEIDRPLDEGRTPDR